MLEAPAAFETRPFVLDGRPDQRVGTTNSVIPQERCQGLLLEQAHARRRWENDVAAGMDIEELDHEEMLRTVRLGIDGGRLPRSTGREIGDIRGSTSGSQRSYRYVIVAVLLRFDTITAEPIPSLHDASFRGESLLHSTPPDGRDVLSSAPLQMRLWRFICFPRI